MHAIRTTAITAAFVGALLSLAAAAGAATLSGVNLLIDTGSGYQAASSPMEVAPGTSVIANPNGEGVIRYQDGCDVKVRPGEVYLIRDVSPCEAGLIIRDEGLGEYGLVIGGVLVGGGVIAAIALTGGDSKGRSP